MNMRTDKTLEYDYTGVTAAVLEPGTLNVRWTAATLVSSVVEKVYRNLRSMRFSVLFFVRHELMYMDTFGGLYPSPHTR